MNGDRAARLAAAAVIAGLIGLAVLASSLAETRARRDASDRDRTELAAVAERITGQLTVSLSGLQGISGIAADGIVTEEEFEAFARAIVPNSAYPALAFSQEVRESQREAWEASTGYRITDTDRRGGFRTAASRPTHVAVRYVTPRTKTTEGVLGFDFRSDRIRSKAVDEATTAERSVLEGPITLATSSQPGLFAMHAVRAPDGRVIGFVSSGMNLDELVTGLTTDGGTPKFTLHMDGAVMFGPERADGPTTTFEAGGRRFVLGLARASTPNRLGLALVLLGSLLLAGFAGLVLRHELAAHRRTRTSATRHERLAMFADGAAVLTSTRAVVAYASQHAGYILDTNCTSLARSSLTDPDKVIVRISPTSDTSPDPVAVQSERPIPGTLTTVRGINDRTPLTDAARSREPVFLPTRSQYRDKYPEQVHADGSGPSAALCLPLALGSDRLYGAIGFDWDDDVVGTDAEDLLGAGMLVAQIVGRAYERGLARELVQARIADLARFTRALTMSRTSAEVRGAVGNLLAPLLGAAAVEVRTEPADGADADLDDGLAVASGVELRRFPLSAPEFGTLVITLGPATIWTDAVETLALTIADLVSAALERTQSYDEQRRVLLRLQYSLLSTPPSVDGYDVAVAYQSAVEAIGIGGDWYSVVENDANVFAIVGDVAGHGAEAVAVMAEVKTIARYLLTKGTDLLEVVREADGVLRRRRSFASLIAVSIDKASGEMAYASAGHLPPVVVGPGGRVLATPQGPWLGLPGSSYRVARAVLGREETLLLYTDGLVEQPGVPLDESIAGLLQRADPLAHPDELIHQLLQLRLEEKVIDDDIAVLAIRRR